MVVDFRTMNIDDRPVLVLKTPSGKVIQTLGFARNLECQFKFAETSQISFEVPAYVNGESVPNYDMLVGEMIIDMVGWGEFILQNPQTENDGIKEVKSCTAYSREYELTHKQIFIEEGTYNFWNPAAREGTLLQLIVDECPGWKVGYVDDALIGKYRTFDDLHDNAYNLMMNSFKKPFKCIFYFDTYAKTINALDANSDVVASPIYLSLQNLVKKVEVSEKSENLVTVLDVNGSDNVDIRAVNPLGTNKMYNLDYFMNEIHFDHDIIEAWRRWKSLFEERRQEYFALSVRRAMKTSEILTLNARKTDEQGELTKLESEQAINIRASTNGDETGMLAKQLVELKKSVDAQNEKIKATDAEIKKLESDNEKIVADLKKVIDEVSFENNFTEEQLTQIYPYFIEDSLTEASFVMNETSAFVDTTTTVTNKDISATITNCNLMRIKPRENGEGGTLDEQIYSFTGGNLELLYNTTLTDGTLTRWKITCEVNRGSAERSGQKIVETSTLAAGTIENLTTGNTITFSGGTFTMVGTNNGIGDDTTPDQDVPNVIYTGKSLICAVTGGDLYITSETTMMEQYAIEWDLYEYAEKELLKLAYPTYTFKVDSANFLALDDFKAFANHLQLGRRNYVDIGDKVLKPILLEVDISFDDLADFSLQFSDTYTGANNAFSLVDLLEQSVTMGHKLDASKFSYNDYVNSGAKTAVKEFVSGALDASKNIIINGENQEIKIDENGLHARKAKGGGDFEDEQLWIINNMIAMTDDGWETSKLAIGHFKDENTGMDNWGVVAPNIVGTLLAGENLVIESPKPSINGGPSGRSLFRVDGEGASLYNSKIEIITPLNPTSDGTARYGDIVLDPEIGFGLGIYEQYYNGSTSDGETINGIVQVDSNGKRKWNADVIRSGHTEEGRATFWVDMDGNLHFKGKLEGADGTFSGKLEVGDPSGEKTGTPKGVYLDSEGNLAIGGIYGPDDELDREPKAKFFVDNRGNMYAQSGKVEGDLYVNNLFFKDPQVEGWSSVLEDHNKIKSKYIDLGNIVLDGESGDVKILGNIDLGEATAINFGTFHPGMEYEYSEDGVSDWHKVKRDSDQYYRTVITSPTIDEDGNPSTIETPGTPIKIADELPDYIKATHIDMSQVSSPSFFGNHMYALSFNVVDHFLQMSDGSTSYGTKLGSMGQVNGNNGVGTTIGVGFSKDSDHYVICSTDGVRMQCGTYDGGLFIGNNIFVTDYSCTMAYSGYAKVDVMGKRGSLNAYSAAMYIGNDFDSGTGIRVSGGHILMVSGRNSSKEALTSIEMERGKIILDTSDPYNGEIKLDTRDITMKAFGFTLETTSGSITSKAAFSITASGSTKFTFSNAGIVQSSDRRLKENIKYSVDGDIVDQLKPAQFNFIGTDFTQYGFIAQDVQEVIPSVVSADSEDDDAMLGINYIGLIPFLTAKIQKQTKQINDLVSRITKLESKSEERGDA